MIIVRLVVANYITKNLRKMDRLPVKYSYSLLFPRPIDVFFNNCIMDFVILLYVEILSI